MDPGGGARGTFPRGVGAGRVGPTARENRFRNDPQVVLVHDRHSHAAEEYRKAAVRLAQAAGARSSPLGLVVVVSALEGEGKTLTAMNTALALAEEGERRTLLVDFDLRRPRLDDFLVERGRPGLAEELRGEDGPQERVQYCPAERLFVLAAGVDPERCVTLLTAERIAALLTKLRGAFDCIVGDCPPILPFAESRVLAAMADAVLLVARAEVTPRAALAESLALIDPDRLLGVVLNALPQGRWSRYAYKYAYRWRGGGAGEGP